MSLKYLLDTNIISQAMRPSPNPNLVEKLAVNKLEIATATVVVHELLYGCFRFFCKSSGDFMKAIKVMGKIMETCLCFDALRDLINFIMGANIEQNNKRLF